MANYFLKIANDLVHLVGELHMIDDQKVNFGTSSDAYIYYDGTDLVINPSGVGSGAVKIGDQWVLPGSPGPSGYLLTTDGDSAATWTDASGLMTQSYLRLDATNDPMQADLEGTDFVKTRDATITYTDGKISSIAKDGGRTLTITRTAYGHPATMTDGILTWTFTYNSDNTTIANWTVT